MSGGFFRGTSADQDTRFSNKQAKLLKSQKFAPELDTLVDVSKVSMDVIKPWIANRVTELLGFEDEVLINFIYGLLEGKVVNGKEIQIQITGFMEKNTGKFMKELWTLLLSAQKNASGVPQQFLDAKEEEIRKKKVESDRISTEIQKKKEIEQEKQRKMDDEIRAAKAVADASKVALKHSTAQPEDDKGSGERNGLRGKNSQRSRSISRSPQSRRRSISPDRRYRSPSLRHKYSPRRSRSPLRRRSPYVRRRSPSLRRRRSPSPRRRRSPSPRRRRSPSPRRRRSPSPARRRSPLRLRRRSPPRLRRRSGSPFRSRSPAYQRKRSLSRDDEVRTNGVQSRRYSDEYESDRAQGNNSPDQISEREGVKQSGEGRKGLDPVPSQPPTSLRSPQREPRDRSDVRKKRSGFSVCLRVLLGIRGRVIYSDKESPARERGDLVALNDGLEVAKQDGTRYSRANARQRAESPHKRITHSPTAGGRNIRKEKSHIEEYLPERPRGQQLREVEDFLDDVEIQRDDRDKKRLLVSLMHGFYFVMNSTKLLSIVIVLGSEKSSFTTGRSISPEKSRLTMEEVAYGPDSENDKNKSKDMERRKHKRKDRQHISSDDDNSYDSHMDERKESKRRRKEEKRLWKEEKHRRREERHRRKEERRAGKQKAKTKETVTLPSDIEKNRSDDSLPSGLEEIESLNWVNEDYLMCYFPLTLLLELLVRRSGRNLVMWAGSNCCEWLSGGELFRLLGTPIKQGEGVIWYLKAIL
ncbi:hypothetical protein IFM89_037517 [Coptis chinensis]|uniref:PWI domain-containing protein n=1 Tax=Coptis chinensis TaxID=261450 RepID=A0A835HYS8_9MAGN|nr:hypothetical protein IFM89_037517 [Coptis chinensis]